MNYFYNHIDTPVGPLTSHVDETGALYGLHFGVVEPANATLDPQATAKVDQQLAEYFAGERREFELDLAPKGTPFQKAVWDLLVKIPFGVTTSYGDLAKKLGNPGASRAVGRANATNPIAIIVPCHRVIGQSGSLTGYAGGLTMKDQLLALEREHASQPTLAI